MKGKIILDSSIWIAIERQVPSVCEKTLPLIQKNRVCLVDVIVAEVLRGCQTEKDFKKLLGAFENFPCHFTLWKTVAELGFKTAKQGFHPPLVDLYIAQCAIENRLTLMTQDKHFLQIARVQSFSLELLPS